MDMRRKIAIINYFILGVIGIILTSIELFIFLEDLTLIPENFPFSVTISLARTILRPSLGFWKLTGPNPENL